MGKPPPPRPPFDYSHLVPLYGRDLCSRWEEQDRRAAQGEKPEIGHPRDFDHDALIAIAEDYMRVNGKPRSKSMLAEKVIMILEHRHKSAPSKRWLSTLLDATFKSWK